jgi:YD repeat-containing protein
MNISPLVVLIAPFVCAFQAAGPSAQSVTAAPPAVSVGPGRRPSNVEPPELPPGAPGSYGAKCGQSQHRVGPLYSTYLFSGETYVEATDLLIPGRGLDFRWSRKYRSKRGPNTPMGSGWDYSYNIRIEASGPHLWLHDGNTRRDLFVQQPDGTFQRDGFFLLGEENLDGSYTFRFPNKGTWEFYPLDGSPEEGRIRAIVDRNANQISFTYDPAGRLVAITDTLNRIINIGYDPDGFIETVTDFTGREVRYQHYKNGDFGGSAGGLKSVRTPIVVGTPHGNDFPNGKTTTYTYSQGFANPKLNNNLLTIADASGQVWLRNVYAATTNPAAMDFDRLVTQTWGNQGDVIDVHYKYILGTPSSGGAEILAVTNDRVGNVHHYRFDQDNRLLVLREFTGRANPDLSTTLSANLPTGKLRPTDPDWYETTYAWNEDHLPTIVTLSNGSQTVNVYERELNPLADRRALGNLRERHRLAGPLGADQAEIREYFDYHSGTGGCCGTDFVTQYTDPRGVITHHEYDAAGNRNRTHRPIVGPEEWDYNAHGQVTEHRHVATSSGQVRRDVYSYYDASAGHQEGRLSQVVQDSGGLDLTSTLAYDIYGNPTQMTDALGADQLVIYNQLNQPVSRLTPEATPGAGDRGESRMWYGATDHLIRIEEKWEGEDAGPQPRWIARMTKYDVLGRVTRQSVREAGIELTAEEYQYDANGSVTLHRRPPAVSGSDPTCVVQHEPDERLLPFRTTSAPGTAEETLTESSYDLNGALARSIVTSTHDTWSDDHMFYDGHGRLIQALDGLTATVTLTSYDANSRVTARTVSGQLVVDGDTSDSVVLDSRNFTYDDLNRQVQSTRTHFELISQAPIGDGASIHTTTWSSLGLVESTVDDEGGVTQYEYDTALRRVTTMDPAGNRAALVLDDNAQAIEQRITSVSDLGLNPEIRVSQNFYDGRGRLVGTTDPLGAQRSWTYNSRNEQTSSIDQRGNTSLSFHDALGRVVRTEEVMTDTGDGGGVELPERIVREWSHDVAGRLESRTDAKGNVTTFEYDALDQLTRTTEADGTATTWSYDGPGLVLRVDANGTQRTSAYTDGLLSSHTTQPAPGVIATSEQFAWDGLERLAWGSDDDSLVAFERDSLGGVIRESLTIGSGPGAVTGVTTASFDGSGQLESLVYPGGRSLQYEFTHTLALHSVKRILEAGQEHATFAYLGGRLQQREVNLGSSGAVLRSDFVFDGSGWLDAEVHEFGSGGNTVAMFDHTFGPTGNHINIQDLLLNRAYSKQFDSADRLVHSEHQRFAGAVEIQDYVLDLQGNRQQVVGGPGAGGYLMDPTNPPGDSQVNQYTQTPWDDRGYDDNGNLVSRSDAPAAPLANTFDHANRAVQMDVAPSFTKALSYDVLGRIIQEEITHAPPLEPELVRFFYCGDRLIEERHGESAPLVATWVWPDMAGGSAPVSMRGVTGQDVALVSSPKIGVVAAVDAAGAVLERYEYRDFGEVLDATTSLVLADSQIGNRFFYQGYRHDLDLGQTLTTGGRRFEPRVARGLSRSLMSSGYVPASGGSTTGGGGMPTILSGFLAGPVSGSPLAGPGNSGSIALSPGAAALGVAILAQRYIWMWQYGIYATSLECQNFNRAKYRECNPMSGNSGTWYPGKEVVDTVKEGVAMWTGLARGHCCSQAFAQAAALCVLPAGVSDFGTSTQLNLVIELYESCKVPSLPWNGGGGGPSGGSTGKPGVPGPWDPGMYLPSNGECPPSRYVDGMPVAGGPGEKCWYTGWLSCQVLSGGTCACFQDTIMGGETRCGSVTIEAG